MSDNLSFFILRKVVQVSMRILWKMPKTIPVMVENILSPYMPHVKALSNAMESSSKVIESLQKEAND